MSERLAGLRRLLGRDDNERLRRMLARHVALVRDGSSGGDRPSLCGLDANLVDLLRLDGEV